MNQTKYIIAEVMGLEIPIIFPDYINHADVPMRKVVAGGFVSIKSIPEDANQLIVDGHCIVNDIEVYCHGKSVSLNVCSREHIDEQIIKEMLVGGRYQREVNNE